jgi:hypothetical protein
MILAECKTSLSLVKENKLLSIVSFLKVRKREPSRSSFTNQRKKEENWKNVLLHLIQLGNPISNLISLRLVFIKTRKVKKQKFQQLLKANLNLGQEMISRTLTTQPDPLFQEIVAKGQLEATSLVVLQFLKNLKSRTMQKTITAKKILSPNLPPKSIKMN